MKFKISPPSLRTDPLHGFWVVIYAIAFGVALSLLSTMIAKFTNPGGIWLSFAPFVEVGGLTIADALARFSGEEIVSKWTLFHTHILFEILIPFVIAPPLFLWGLRERALWRQVAGERRFPTRIALALGFSAPIVAGLVMLSLIPPFIHYSVRLSLMKAQTVQANRDALINDINYAALGAQSFYYVDVKDGGGAGRWMNIERAGSPTLTVEEIASPTPIARRVVERLFPQQPSHFLLNVHAADSLTIIGVAAEEGDDEAYVNADGRKGRIQLSMIVTPKRIKVTSDN